MGKGFQQPFLQSRYKNNRCMKRCSLLTIRKMKIKTTMRYQFMYIRIASIKKCKVTRVGQDVLKLLLSLVLCWWKCKIVEALWKTIWWFLYIVGEIELPHDPTIPFLGICYGLHVCTPQKFIRLRHNSLISQT